MKNPPESPMPDQPSEFEVQAGAWLSTGQVASQLGVRTPTVRDWISRGTLVGHRVGSRWYVAAESMKKVLGLRRILADMEREGYLMGEFREPARPPRRGAGAQERRKVVG